MPKPFQPSVVTANHLLDGDVIYQTAADEWSRNLSDAEVLTDEADAQIRLLHAQSQPAITVGAYLAEVAVSANGAEPTHFREEFRKTGPSNYAHGKQVGATPGPLTAAEQAI